MSGMGSFNGTLDSQSQFSGKRRRSSTQQIDSFTAGPNHASGGLFGYLTASSAELTEGNDQ